MFYICLHKSYGNPLNSLHLFAISKMRDLNSMTSNFLSFCYYRLTTLGFQRVFEFLFVYTSYFA